MTHPALQWLLLPPAAIFYCTAASAMQETLELTGDDSALAAALAAAFLPCSIALWVLADSRQRRLSVHFDFGTFVFFAWPMLVPIYLFSTRGWRGFATIGWFVLLYLAALFVGSIPCFFLASCQ